MAFTESMLWNTDGTGDGPAGGYSRNHWGTLLRTLFGTGVLRGVGDELIVSGAASPLSVGIGAAVVDGIFGINPSPEDVAVPTPSVGTTGHRIVLRATWGATQTLRVALKSNADGVPLSTQVPELQQDSGVLYEVALARFDITTAGVIQGLVNEQGFCHFATYLQADDIPDGAITNAKVAAGAAIAQSKISNASRAIDADKVDGMHASDFVRSNDHRMVSLVGLDNDPWPIPTGDLQWRYIDFHGDVTGLVFTLNGPCDLKVDWACTVKGSTGGTWTFRAEIDGWLANDEYSQDGWAGCHTIGCHYLFENVQAGSHTMRMQFKHDGNPLNPGIGWRRMTVEIVPR